MPLDIRGRIIVKNNRVCFYNTETSRMTLGTVIQASPKDIRVLVPNTGIFVFCNSRDLIIL